MEDAERSHDLAKIESEVPRKPNLRQLASHLAETVLIWLCFRSVGNLEADRTEISARSITTAADLVVASHVQLRPVRGLLPQPVGMPQAQTASTFRSCKYCPTTASR